MVEKSKLKCSTQGGHACNTGVMFENAFKNLDSRKWFDRMHPQTLAIAIWLSYIDGVFALLGLVDKQGEFGAMRYLGGIRVLFAIAAVSAYFIGPFLMANGKRLGWYVAVAASFSPLLIRFTSFYEGNAVYSSFTTRITGGDLFGFMFEAALCALLLHNMTRSYVRTWLR
jgi:hypothetical protein